MPDFALEKAAACLVCGIDEVGRGPLAGPVTAAAVLFDSALFDRRRFPKVLRDGLDDSKKLSASKREALFAALHDCPGTRIGIAHASVAEIDAINILRASHLAMQRALEQLDVMPELALIDGNQAPHGFPCPTRCVIKGDGLSLSIAAASIAAKVTRDRLMVALAEHFPGYGWERNMGYGTAEHRDAIRRIGLTEHHRRSFTAQYDLFEVLAPSPAPIA